MLLKTLLFVCLILGVNSQVFFKVNNTDFIIKKNDQWEIFDKFAGINMGVTPPGFFPGNVELRRPDYLRRFEKLQSLGVHVLRIYALAHPDFYKTLLEWNESHEHKLYVFHGTAFPEYELEENNGTNAYDDIVNTPMKRFIKNTVKGAYGGGIVPYRYIRGVEPVNGNFKYDIGRYIIGWSIAGEITPHAINKTNKDTFRPVYNGTYISARNDSTPFESWMASMLDYTAKNIKKYGYEVPISNTNWITTDGLSNPVEPSYPTSVEDWEEIDQKKFIANNWEGGIFYNVHAYPYYPYFVSISLDGEDPYYKYLKKYKDYYNDKPAVITEVGLSTSLGVASYDPFAGRNHGHVGEKDQGIFIEQIIREVILKLNYSGVLVFQLHDEWFKKTWNNLKYDRTGRHNWHNYLSAEEHFGLFSVTSTQNINSITKNGNRYIKQFKVSNDVGFVKIKFDIGELYEGRIVIGINSLIEGSKIIKNLNIPKEFREKINSVLIVDLDKKTVKYKTIGTYNGFLRNYGVWLSSEDNLVLPYPIEKIIDPDEGLFFDFKKLVRVPSYYVNPQNNSLVFYNHLSYTLEFLNKNDLGQNDNLGLFTETNGIYEIKIPYLALGITDPSDNVINVFSGQGNDFKVETFVNDKPIYFEASYIVGDLEIQESIITTKFSLDTWYKPKRYCESPKNNFYQLKSMFHEINKIPYQNYSFDGKIYCFDDNKEHILDEVIGYITTGCFIIITFIFFYSSIGKWLMRYCFPCYSYKEHMTKEKGNSNKIRLLNFFFLLVFIGIWYLGTVATRIEYSWVSLLYIIMLSWETFCIIFVMIFSKHLKWSVNSSETYKEYDEDTHAFIISCHNSSDVIENTLKSLLTKVKPHHIYVADNGSTIEEHTKTNEICKKLSNEYYNEDTHLEKQIRCGDLRKGNKTISQFFTITSLPSTIKFVTCIDDDTRLDDSWKLNKVLEYFEDPEVAVLAYPLKVDNPKYTLEFFQHLEYLIAGFFKIFTSKIRSTVFNSGAFGTYRVDVVKRAMLKHNCNFHGDDLQICLNIHNLRDKINIEGKEHYLSYKVKTANNIICSTIVPKCFFHINSLFRNFSKKQCSCDNPDLFKQRVKGWNLSEHRFISRFLSVIFNFKNFTIKSLWVRFIILYDLCLVLNQYLSIILLAFLVRELGVWMLEGFLITITFNILVLIIFNQFFLKKNNCEVAIEIVTIQPILYKLMLVTLYRYISIFYNLFIYTPSHRNGKIIQDRLKNREFRIQQRNMYSNEYFPFNDNNNESYFEDDLDSFKSSPCNSQFNSPKKINENSTEYDNVYDDDSFIVDVESDITNNSQLKNDDMWDIYPLNN